MIRLFNINLSKGILLLLAIESALLLLAIPFGVDLRFHGAPVSPSTDVIWTNALLFLTVGLAVMSAFGLYRRDFDEGLGSMLFRVAASFLLILAGMAALYYVFPGVYLGRGALGAACVAGLGAVLLMRATMFRWADLDILKHRMLVLGTGTRAAKVMELLRAADSQRRMHMVGFLPLQGLHHFVDHSLILSEQAPLPEVVDKYQIDEIVIAVRERRGGGLPVKALLECKLKGVHIILSEGFQQGFLRDVVKRLFDLGTSLILLLISIPIMILAAIVIAIESGFPILYRQERVGLGGKIFTIFKFRSMVQNAEKDGTPQWAQAGDARVTWVGSVIRKLRIDELPQIFNVFRGDMSFVGPRPERSFFVDQLLEQVPYYAARHSIKPGITGWAQVRYPYGASLEDAIEKLQYDLYYVKNHTFFLDLLILSQTAQVVLFGKGAR
jgi:lipopolysaccharide/colanic/teichoic acid biosynthesis glycosyltransferase